MDSLQGLRLPSMAKFSAGIASCNSTFTDKCLGPSKTLYQKRLEKVKNLVHIFNPYQTKEMPSCLLPFNLSLIFSDPLLLPNFSDVVESKGPLHQQLQPAPFQLDCGVVSGHGGNRSICC